MNTKNLRARLRAGLCGLGVAALLPATAFGQDTCNGFINIDYVNAGICTDIDQTVDMKVSFGTGSIQNGTSLTITTFQLNLDCDSTDPLTPPCTDETMKVGYEGDATISTDCGVVWSTGHPIGPDPNVVVFTATPPLVIPADQDTLPGFCSITFTVRKLEESEDPTLDDIEQLVGYETAQCDNGVLLTGGFQTSSLVRCVEAVHFQCYQIPRNKTTKPNEFVSVEDQFGSDDSVEVVRAEDLCAPVDKNGENPGAENSPVHLVRYILDDVDGFATVPGVTVANQFGDFVLDVKAPDQLLVPTAKSVVPAGPPPPLAPDAFDHYLCHRVDVKEQPDLNSIDLTLIDQFSAPDSYSMKLERVDRLCAPVSKNGEPVIDEDAHLLCFRTDPQEKIFDFLNVNLVNQFFDFDPQQVRITREQEFCVESRKFLP